MNAINLKCDGLINPMGIDSNPILISWNLSGSGFEQRAYEIRAAHSLSEIENGEFFFESPVVESKQMISNLWPTELQSREIVYWQVRITDESGNPGDWSEWAKFEVGLLENSEWTGKWISGNYVPQKGKRYPVDEFKKELFIENKIKKARLYISACGIYAATLNGKRIGDFVLAPGFTTYEKRVQYQTYDVKEYLKPGSNTLKISLGDGWFRGKTGAFGASGIFGDTTAVIGQLEIEYVDGTREMFVTDDSFEWSNDGKIVFNDLKDGETVDFRNSPSYSNKARIVEWKGKLCCSNNVPVKEHEHFVPKVLKTPDGGTVLDFGQNIAGYMEFSIEGENGHEAVIQFGEMLDEEGNFTVKNIVNDETSEFVPDYCDDSRFQTIKIICNGERESYKPQFSTQGFRYAKLMDWPEEVNVSSFEAIAVYSDLEFLLDFESSSGEINRLVENTLWSIKGNFLDVPTDCPTRERSPWTGDSQLFFNTGCYFADMQAFFTKWIRDLYDDQAPDGKIYNIVPRCAEHEGMNAFVEGSSGWTDAGILIPYRMYKQYKDKELLKTYYPKMKDLLEFLLSRMGDESDPELDAKLPRSDYRKYVVTSGFHFGEWNEPGSTPMSVMEPKFEVATAYLNLSLKTMSEIAEVLGEENDRKRYEDLAKKTAEAYRYYFVKNNSIDSDKMCSYVRPVALNLVDEKSKEILTKDLVKLVKDNNYKVGTGFLSTPFLLPVISEYGDIETAYKIIENPEYPGWIAEIKSGATTIWENWEGNASRNHYSNGAVCEWLFKYAAGISVIDDNEFLIRPMAGGTFTFMNLAYKSVYGNVSCYWRVKDNSIEYRIHIPKGCRATIDIEGMASKKVKCGDYYFEIAK